MDYWVEWSLEYGLMIPNLEYWLVIQPGVESGIGGVLGIGIRDGVGDAEGRRAWTGVGKLSCLMLAYVLLSC